MPEWTNGAVSKTVDVARHPWVRIPSLPQPPLVTSEELIARPRSAPGLVAGSYRAWLDCAAEAWPSGRRHTPGKRVGGQLPRGFEPLSLRHETRSSTCGFPQAVVRWSALGPCPLRQGGIPAPSPGGRRAPPSRDDGTGARSVSSVMLAVAPAAPGARPAARVARRYDAATGRPLRGPSRPRAGGRPHRPFRRCQSRHDVSAGAPGYTSHNPCPASVPTRSSKSCRTLPRTRSAFCARRRSQGFNSPNPARWC